MNTTPDVQYMDHLGLIAGICKQAGLAESIDSFIGPQQRKVSVGQSVVAMIINALGFTSRAIYLTPKFYKHRPTERLIGEGITPEALNESSLGTALDAIYDTGITELFFSVASNAFATFGIPVQWGHLDSTSFSLHGEYTEDGDDEDRCEIKITKGFSKDHNPDMNQVVLQMITANKSTLPIWIEVLSGNSSDKKSFRETVQKFQKQFTGAPMPYMVMDSAFYSEGSIQACTDVSWITRVPETLKEIKNLYTSFETTAFVDVGGGYEIQSSKCTYGGVDQRWLLVRSEKARIRELKTLEKRIAKTTEKERTAFMHLRNQPFSCEADAIEEGRRFAKGLKFQSYEPVVIEKKRHSGRGRPKKDSLPTYSEFFLAGELAQNEQAIAGAMIPKGLFVIATNVMDAETLSDQQILEVYKAQSISVERGFRFLKDPLFYAESLYLKSPKRIMALIMVMTLSLLMYSLAEKKLRESLDNKDLHVWDQKNKPTKKPTLRWVFMRFEKLAYVVSHEHGRTHVQLCNLDEFQRRVLNALGPDFEKIYLSG